MWLVKSKKTLKEFVWSNKKTDDFLRFIPRQVSIMTSVEHTPEDLEVFCAKDEFKALCALSSMGLDVIARDGNLVIRDLKANADVEVLEIEKLKCWPYDGVKFLGHVFC